MKDIGGLVEEMVEGASWIGMRSDWLEKLAHQMH